MMFERREFIRQKKCLIIQNILRPKTTLFKMREKNSKCPTRILKMRKVLVLSKKTCKMINSSRELFFEK